MGHKSPSEVTVSGAPSDDVLRAALRRAIGASSLRAVAEQVGLTHRGLQLYVTGESRPREATARKLRDWYVREGVHAGGVTMETVRAAVDVLLADLPAAERGRASSDLIEVVRQLYRRAKMDPPAWTQDVG